MYVNQGMYCTLAEEVRTHTGHVKQTFHLFFFVCVLIKDYFLLYFIYVAEQ